MKSVRIPEVKMKNTPWQRVHTILQEFLPRKRECPKPPTYKNQRALVGGSWSDSGEEDDEKAKDETC
ncbi:hypothetical protein Tco_1283965 [Tanacetum coccineum]